MIRHTNNELGISKEAIDELMDFMRTAADLTLEYKNPANVEWFKQCSFFDYFGDSMVRVAPWQFTLNTGNYDIEYNNSTDIRLEQMWQSCKMYALMAI